MFDRIVFISDHAATIKLKNSENITMNLMNLHLIFEDDTKKVLGEVNDVNGDTVNASFLGEFVGNKFLGGTIRKPRLDAKVRVINDEEILLITGKEEHGYMELGKTPFYDGIPVYLDVNNFFSSHFAIMGNSGSGKSCGISRLFQNMFRDKKLNPCNANIIMLDSSGEYYNAFKNLDTISPNYHYRFISTNEKAPVCEKLRIPIYLLNEADLALLLQVTTHSQLPIIERMRKLALVFSQKDVDANNYKNHLIAKAIMTILYTNETAPNKRNEIFSVLASCSTPQFNLEAPVQGLGYTRKFRECFLIDNSGNFSESVLITEYVSSFIDDSLDSYEPHDGVFYTLDTLEKALNFTLISEGWLRNKNTYGDAVTIKVRLHSLIVGNNAKFFDVKEYMTTEQFLKSLVSGDGLKYQFVNINLDDVDDDFAKVITKIYSRLIFDFSKGLTQRASLPFHIIIEEAHRYIQNDNDRFLIGYNIFERIAKEGRKYGVILGIITQRPVELSDTVISQCSNFLIFKMNHPVDVEYIRKMVPNISDEIVEKQKTLQSGTCLGFGGAFRIPMIVKMDMPNPAPWSGNCDVVSYWGGSGSAISNMVDSPISKEVSNNDVKSVLDITIPTLSGDLSVSNKTSSVGGEFSLLGSLNRLETQSNIEEKGSSVPSGNLSDVGVGVNLVDFSTNNSVADFNDDITASSSVPLVDFIDVPQLIEQEISQSNSNPRMEKIASLVSFNDEKDENNIDNSASDGPVLLNENVVGNKTNEVKSESSNAFNPNDLVSFSVNTGVPAPTEQNITAAPQVDENSFIVKGSDLEETAPSFGINFVNNSIPSGMGTEEESAVPNLVSINSLSTVQPKQLNLDSNNDAFGKPEFTDLNSSGPMTGESSFTNLNASTINGYVPNVPKDMNFGGNQNNMNRTGAEPLSFNTGSSLVSFLDQL